MALDREERFLMRQRGAGKHKIQDADFGFEILPPSSSVKSAQFQSTPARSLLQEELSRDSTARPNGRYRSIPESEPQEQFSDAGSIQRYESEPRTRSVSIELGGGIEDGSQKRRRLVDGLERVSSTNETTPLIGGKLRTPSTVASLPRNPASRSSRLSSTNQAEIPDSTDDRILVATSTIDRGQTSSRTGSVSAKQSWGRVDLRGTPPVEAPQPDSSTSSTARRRRGRPSKSQSNANAIDGGIILENPSATKESIRGERTSRRPLRYDIAQEDEYDSQEELHRANEAKRKEDKKRRRQAAHRRGSVEPETLRTNSERIVGADASKDNSERSEEEDDSSDPDDPSYKSVRKRPASAPAEEEIVEIESEADELEETRAEGEGSESAELRKVSPAPISWKGKAPARPPEVNGSKPKSKSKKKPPQGQNPQNSLTHQILSAPSAAPRQPPGTVPILVHRLPISKYTKEDEDSEDDLVKENFVRRGGVNAIDVLGQICRELVAKTIDLHWQQQHNEQNNFKKGELRRKRKVVEAFGTELDARCLEMTETLDNNHALSTRLKAAHKKKIELREQLLQVRKEREKIAIRTDEVKRRHVATLRAIEEQIELNSAMEGLELAVQQGRARQAEEGDDADAEPAGVEYLLKSVAADVSSASAQGSLLMRVREFNDFLERAAEALESHF